MPNSALLIAGVHSIAQPRERGRPRRPGTTRSRQVKRDQLAGTALDELRQAGILSTKPMERGATAYLAREVLDLVTLSTPVQPLPARPEN